MIVSLWNLTGISAALLPRCQKNFSAIVKIRPESCHFETSRDPAVKRPSPQWREAQGHFKVSEVTRKNMDNWIIWVQNNRNKTTIYLMEYILYDTTTISLMGYILYNIITIYFMGYILHDIATIYLMGYILYNVTTIFLMGYILYGIATIYLMGCILYNITTLYLMGYIRYNIATIYLTGYNPYMMPNDKPTWCSVSGIIMIAAVKSWMIGPVPRTPQRVGEAMI